MAKGNPSIRCTAAPQEKQTMSKDMLGSITRALVGIPDSRLGVVADIANRLNSHRGEEWDARLKAVLREGLAPPAPTTTFERNEHGHVIITFTGLDLSGVEEIKRLEEANFRVGNYAKSCFKSTMSDSYDKNHRLVAGQPYKIALITGKEIPRDSDRTTLALRKLGEKYGYGKPLGGHVPHIRKVVSDKVMEEMEIWYIASLHEPIKASDGYPSVLDANRHGGGRGVSTFWGDPGFQWDVGGAFAFPVAAS